MFQYTNTYIVNNDKTPSGESIFKFENGVLKVLKVNDFKSECIVAIYKNPAQAERKGKVEFDLTTLNDPTKNYRLFMYARLSGNNMSYFANDFVFKGRPFVFEIPSSAISGSGADATAVAKALNSVLNMYNDKFLKVSANAGKLVIEGNNYVLFKVAKAQVFNNASINGPETVASYTGSWVDVVDGTITTCINGFGTYMQLIKDIKLPTMENRRFTALHLDEMPVPGALYDQYIIHYCVNRGVLGTDAVGDLVKSATTHVFFVKQDIESEIETAMKNAVEANGGEIQIAGSDNLKYEALEIPKAGYSVATAIINVETPLKKPITFEGSSEDITEPAYQDGAIVAKVGENEIASDRYLNVNIKAINADTEREVSVTIPVVQKGA